MTKHEKKILSEIINLEGACLSDPRCKHCPFKKKCLPEFISPKKSRPSKSKRLAMALDTLTNLELLGETTAWRTKEK